MAVRRSGSRHPPIGAWLAIGMLSAALTALILVWFSGGRWSNVKTDPDGGTTPRGAAVDDTIPGGPRAVNEYLMYVALHQGASDANRYHDYTADGLRGLAAALSALLQFDPGTAASQRMQIVALYQRAEDLQRDPTSTKHAEFARSGFVTAAEVSRWLQERNAGVTADMIEELRAAALRLDPSVPLLQQTAEVERYFDRASAVVRALAIQRDIDRGRTT